MLDAVFAQSGTTGSVTPVMFGDKFFVRRLGGLLRLTGRSHRQGFPTLSPAPLVFRQNAAVLVLERMPHRQGGIGLAVKRPCYDRDRLSRNKLADERDSTPPVIDVFAAHIETETHLLEIAMQGNGQTENASVEKEKTDDAQKVCPSWKSSSVPDGTSGSRSFGSTTKFSIAR